jgi:hypothetical protein
MGFKIEKLATDASKELTGTWTEDLGDGLKLLVAREGNVKYNEEMRRAVKAKIGASGLGDASAEDMAEAAADVYSRCVLLGWEGLEEDGKTLEYSPETAKRLLKTYPDFFRIVQGQARRVDLFRTKRMLEAQGNSQSGSDGT